MHKLENYGVNASIYKWISKFLEVFLDDQSLYEVSVECRVPQGSVLGLLLFLCHINDLTGCVKSHMLADDCLFYHTIKSFQDHLTLQNDLLQLETWAQTWRI